MIRQSNSQPAIPSFRQFVAGCIAQLSLCCLLLCLGAVSQREARVAPTALIALGANIAWIVERPSAMASPSFGEL